MAVKYPYQVKTVAGASDLELEADSGESFLVKNIRIFNPAGTHVTIRVGRRTVGYYRVSGPLGNHLSIPRGMTRHAHDWTTGSTAAADQTLFVGLENAGATEVAAKMIGQLVVDTTYPYVGGLSTAPSGTATTLLDLMFRLGLWRGIPVAEGEKLVITGASQAGAIQIVEYEVADAGDHARDAPNGSESSELDYVSYGNTGAAVTAAGDAELDTPVNPSEFPAFPYGKEVPAGRTITLLGLLASDFATGEHDGTDGTYTTFLKMFRNDRVLFDEDRAGIPVNGLSHSAALVVDRVGEGVSLIGNYSDRDYRMPWFPPEPMVFTAGEELVMSWTYALDNAGKSVGLDDQEVGCILRMAAG